MRDVLVLALLGLMLTPLLARGEAADEGVHEFSGEAGVWWRFALAEGETLHVDLEYHRASGQEDESRSSRSADMMYLEVDGTAAYIDTHRSGSGAGPVVSAYLPEATIHVGETSETRPGEFTAWRTFDVTEGTNVLLLVAGSAQTQRIRIESPSLQDSDASWGILTEADVHMLHLGDFRGRSGANAPIGARTFVGGTYRAESETGFVGYFNPDRGVGYSSHRCSSPDSASTCFDDASLGRPFLRSQTPGRWTFDNLATADGTRLEMDDLILVALPR